MVLSAIGIVVALAGLIGLVISTFKHPTDPVSLSVFLVLVVGLLWGNLAYQISRLGFHARRRTHDSSPPRPGAGCSGG